MQVACSNHCNSPNPAPREVSTHCPNEALQDKGHSSNVIVDVKPTTSRCTREANAEASRKEPSTVSSPCKQVRFNLPPSALVASQSTQQPSKPLTTLLQRSHCSRDTPPHYTSTEIHCKSSPQRPSTKYNNWTIPASSHPLSQHQCARLSCCSKQRLEAKLENFEYDKKTDDDDNDCEADNVGEESEDESEMECSSPKCWNPEAFFSLAKPPLSPLEMDRVKRYFNVDIDTDFIAHFNYNFFNDNII